MRKTVLLLALLLLYGCGYRYQLSRNLAKTRRHINRNLDSFNLQIMRDIEDLERKKAAGNNSTN